MAWRGEDPAPRAKRRRWPCPGSTTESLPIVMRKTVLRTVVITQGDVTLFAGLAKVVATTKMRTNEMTCRLGPGSSEVPDLVREGAGARADRALLAART